MFNFILNNQINLMFMPRVYKLSEISIQELESFYRLTQSLIDRVILNSKVTGDAEQIKLNKELNLLNSYRTEIIEEIKIRLNETVV